MFRWRRRQPPTRLLRLCRSGTRPRGRREGLAGKGIDLLKSRALRLLGWATLALVLLWAAAWLALPQLLKWQLQTRGSELLGRELRVGQLQFAPTSLALTLRDLSLGAAPGDPDSSPQLRVERLFVDIDARSLLRLAPVISGLEIDAPQLRLARLGPGRYDIDDLLQRLAPKPADPPAEPARFALFNLRLADGQVKLEDRPVERSHVLSKLRLDLPFISNLPADVQVKVEPRLAFELNGTAFDNQGRTTPFAEGRASEFRFRFDPLELKPMWAYLPATLPVRPLGGRLGGDLTLRFEQPRGGVARVELLGQIGLEDFKLQPPGNLPLLSWQRLHLQLANVRPLQRSVVLDALRLDGLELHLRRDASGRLELQRLAEAVAAAPAPAAAAASAPAAPAAEPGWQLQLALLELKDARVHWIDATLQPAAEIQLDGIQLQLQQLQWPFESDARLSVGAQLQAQGKAQGAVQLEGTLSDRQARLALQLQEIDLGLAEPYMRQLLRPRVSARLNAAAAIDWARGDAPRLKLGLSTLRIDDLRLAEPQAARRASRPGPALVQLARLELGDVQADLLQRRVGIGSLSLQRPSIELSRDAAGVLNIESWRVGGAVTAAEPKAVAAPPWQLTLREFKLDGGRARFADAALPAGALQLSALRAGAQGLAWPARAPVQTQLSANLALEGVGGSADVAPARIDWRGRISVEPPGADGQLRLERLPVHVFEPYFAAALPVTLRRLEAGYQGQVELQMQPQGPSARLRGDALLADLRVLAAQAPSAAAPARPGEVAADELLSWNALNLNRLDFRLLPGSKPRVEIGELRLADFFSRLEISEEGRFNLQNVAAAPPGAAASPAVAAVVPAEPAASAPEPSASTPDSVLSRLPIELLIESMQFSNGRIDFNDRFVRPNYRADLSELKGSVGRLDSRSRDMAQLQFSGRVAGTGLLEIGGALNPTVVPPALDIKAKAHDIELPGLTPYSSKYAGYPIERGKLSVDVAYKIEPDGKLEASNQVIVNQLTFGPRSDSPDATKLPVPFIVALLQDRHGVIDLDLPLTGSVNDPQFSLGALIWKVVVNLFTKIITSPFAAIGGGGKDLSHVDFEPGTALIVDSSLDVIARVAKALDDRPQLKLGIVAMADPLAEADAMRRAAFEARLLDEQRRERGRAALGSGGPDAALPPLSAEQRTRLIKQLYDDTRLPDKPRNLVGMAKTLPVAEMEAMLVAAMPVDAAAGRALAQQRGRTVRELLMAKGLAGERLFLGEPKLRPEAPDNPSWVPQAQLTLSVN
jgi:uncharacterized protein involved in outer membrane biogenesis